LFSAIDPLRHKAVVKEGVLEVKLFKKIPVIWEFLESQAASEDEAVEMRMGSLKNQEALEKELSVKRKDKRVEDERHSLRKQMALDETERTRIDNLKAEEKQKAEEEMFDYFSKMNADKRTGGQNSTNTSSCLAQPLPEQSLNRLEFSKLNKPIIEEEEEDLDADEIISSKKVDEDWTLIKHEELDECEGDAELKYVPPPRAPVGTAGGKVEINFTPRLFPTPIRESKLAEEEDWIAKNRKHLKKHAVYGKSLKSGIVVTYLLIIM
jgi:dyslexia susceptibility 1 candidate gene 1 protein